jgi:hypothetical protein
MSSFTKVEDGLNPWQSGILGQAGKVGQFIHECAQPHKPSPAFRALMLLFKALSDQLK